MKKLALLFACLLLTAAAFSQTQQGHVRTLGRPDKKGEALEGVIVRVKGEHNTILSDEKGNFSMLLSGLINGESYSLQQVQKTGYQLNEADFIGRRFAFSDKVPLTIVMVSSEQLQTDIQRIENTAFATAQRNYSDKMSLMEKQLIDNEITKEQYQAAIIDLQDKFEKYQSLIDGLAEHYAHTDYDMLDEKEREINLCIENGDLNCADSLLQTLFDPIEDIRRNKEALDELNRQIEQAQGVITQANEDMVTVLKQQEKDAEYLYQLYTIAAARFDYDKAGFYIETRAELDSTRYEWQFDAGMFCYHQKQLDKSEKYLKRALQLLDKLLANFKESRDKDLDFVNLLQWMVNYNIVSNNLSVLYNQTFRLKESVELLSETMDFFDGWVAINPKIACDVIPLIGYYDANSKMVLAQVFLGLSNFKKSEDMMLEALKIYKRIAKAEPATYEVELAKALSDLGVVYKRQMEDTDRKTHKKLGEKGEQYFQESLAIIRRLAKADPKTYEPELARILQNTGSFYRKYLGKYAECVPYFEESIEIYRRLAKTDPKTYEVKASVVMSLLANYYLNNGKYSLCEPIHIELHEMYQRFAQEDPETYEPKLVLATANLGILYHATERYVECASKFLEAMELFDQLPPDERSTIEQGMSTIPLDIKKLAPYLASHAKELRNEKQYKESETYYLKAIEVYRWMEQYESTSYDAEIAGILNGLGILYANTKRYEEGQTAFSESLEAYQRLAITDPDTYQPEVERMQENLKVLTKEMNKP